jgi:hypothetical protein
LEELKNIQVAAVAPPAHAAPAAAPAQTAVAALPDASATAPLGQAPTSNAGNAFDGLWQFDLTGGPYCFLKTASFPHRISGGVITRNGNPIGSIDKDGNHHFVQPSAKDADIPVQFQGKIKGETGEGSYAGVGTRCKGIYKVHLIRRLDDASSAVRPFPGQ